mmetsp:Transcript_26728/g.76498  ORF Transcript_26728/g.76498 Transcript_26728/m.76498 type:complete len:211 (-) Transcript_26728:82-714(-)
MGGFKSTRKDVKESALTTSRPQRLRKEPLLQDLLLAKGATRRPIDKASPQLSKSMVDAAAPPSARKSAGDAALTRGCCESLINAEGGTLCTALAMINVERSTFSIGFALFWITVSVTVLSKQCVAATTTCKLACSTGKAPDFVSASKRSKASSLALFCSASRQLASLGWASRPRCERFVQTSPGLMIVGRGADSGSRASKRASTSLGNCV